MDTSDCSIKNKYATYKKKGFGVEKFRRLNYTISQSASIVFSTSFVLCNKSIDSIFTAVDIVVVQTFKRFKIQFRNFISSILTPIGIKNKIKIHVMINQTKIVCNYPDPFRL
jgi:hypothetical protein